MTRYTIFLVIAAFSAASAIAAVASKQEQHETPSSNVTVIEKNQAFPQVGPLIFEECLDSDCSTTRG